MVDEAIRDNHLEMPILVRQVLGIYNPAQSVVLQASLLNVLITNLQHIFC